MPKIITVQGATASDEVKRFECLEKLNDQDTVVLERLAELSNSQKAKNYLTSSILYATLKGFLK